MNNKEMRDFNTKIGYALLQMRKNAGLTFEDVQSRVKHKHYLPLNDIESGATSIRCCDLYDLIMLYSPTEAQFMEFYLLTLKVKQ